VSDSIRRDGNEKEAHGERIVIIRNPYGLHARPAAEFVKLSSQFTSRIKVEKDGLEVNGKSIMGVMMLAAECGSSLRIRADGQDAVEAVEALATLVGDRFGEAESDYEIES
jgi:phosphocarrier protein